MQYTTFLFLLPGIELGDILVCTKCTNVHDKKTNILIKYWHVFEGGRRYIWFAFVAKILR
jgi:hypothetical protein